VAAEREAGPRHRLVALIDSELESCRSLEDRLARRCREFRAGSSIVLSTLQFFPVHRSYFYDQDARLFLTFCVKIL
jgi:hypothetical protein